jgi:hypothetical protein
MRALYSKGFIGSLLFVSSLLPACSRKATTEAVGRKLQDAEEASPKALPSPGVTVEMLLRSKISDEDYMQAITVLESANVNGDVELAIKNGDHRLLGIREAVLEAPGVQGDWRNLPQGAHVVTVAGTSSSPGTKYQQRFQMLSRRYAAKYNALLLASLH